MRVVVVMVVVAALSGWAHAQTVQSVVSIPPEWGAAEVWRWVEADGNPATREVIVRRWSDYRYLVVRVLPNGTLCHAGNWFHWAGDPFAYPEVVRVPGTKRERVFVTVGGHYVEMSIDVPPGC